MRFFRVARLSRDELERVEEPPVEHRHLVDHEALAAAPALARTAGAQDALEELGGARAPLGAADAGEGVEGHAAALPAGAGHGAGGKALRKRAAGGGCVKGDRTAVAVVEPQVLKWKKRGRKHPAHMENELQARSSCCRAAARVFAPTSAAKEG